MGEIHYVGKIIVAILGVVLFAVTGCSKTIDTRYGEFNSTYADEIERTIQSIEFK